MSLQASQFGVQQPDPKTIAKVAMKMFFNISQEWALNPEQMKVLLGEPSNSLFYKWKRKEVSSLSKDTLERISFIAGIYKALQILFENKVQASGWIKRHSTDFNGRSALEVMLGGSIVDLAFVRRYLDAMRG